MKHFRSRDGLVLLLLIVIPCAAQVTRPPHSISPWTVSGGETSSSDGTIRLNGSVAQSTIGIISGTQQISAGFFAAVTAAWRNPGVPWANGQHGQYVIGQPDWTSVLGTITDQGMNSVYSIAIDVEHGKMYVADYNSNRVLRFPYPISGNYPHADLVFGQQDFTTGSQLPTAASTFVGPIGVAVHNSTLWVADYFNNRVLRFGNAYALSSNGPPANGVLGQPDFTSNGYATTQTGMSGPTDVWADEDGRLWVTEYTNDRVLRFDNAASKPNGGPANGVVGQSDFTSTLSQDHLSTPVSASLMGTTLWVSDYGRERIARYDSAAYKANGVPPNALLNTSYFVVGSPPIDNNCFSVRILRGDPNGALYAADYANNRVLIFLDAQNKIDGAGADIVIGHPDFTTVGGGTSDSTLYTPYSLALDPLNNVLMVGDEGNNRVVQFGHAGATGVGKDRSRNALPMEFALYQNYPNPFNPSTTINFDLPSAGEVSLIIYDIVGREVIQLAGGRREAGHYSIIWSASSCASGVYFYRLQTGAFVQTKKMLLLK